jgi:hypothetical protein
VPAVQAAPATPVTPATPVATTPAGTLTHVPVYSPTGDVYFTLPAGRDWREAMDALPALTQLMPTGTLQGEHVLGIWRRTISGGPYVYIQAIAIDLAPHPEVSGVDDLANLKLGFLRRDSDTFQVGGLQSTTAGGKPALQADSTAGRRFPGGPSGRGPVSAADLDRYVTQRNPGSPVTELIWTARDVFVVRGNWGYNFRLFSTGPGVTSAHEGDLSQLLASLTFNY